MASTKKKRRHAGEPVGAPPGEPTPAGAPRATTQLDLVASRAELTLEAPVCGQTDPISKGCLEWTCTVTASADATDGSFVLVGTATAVDGTRLPVTVPLTVGNSADTCCGAIYAPVDNTIVVGS